MITRNSPVSVLPGIGKVKAAAYAKLGILTLGDLILHYPRAYENRGEIRELAEARPDGKSALILTVGNDPKVVRLRSHKSFLKFKAFDDSGVCEITYFNQDYLKSVFPVGSVFRFWGKVEQKGYTLVPLKVYFKDALVKIELGLCRGKELHDKRAAIKEKEIGRSIERTMKEYR